MYAKEHGRPDVIYASSVHPLTLVAGIQLARHFGVKCICEVRDLWPMSLLEYGIISRRSPLLPPLHMLEKWIYAKADALIFTMEGAYAYIEEQHWEKAVPREKVYHLNNGVDLVEFDANRDRYILEDEDLAEAGFFKVVYTGSIRKVNNLGLLLDAAKLVQNPKIRFLIWGDGEELETLRQRTREEQIHNVVFKGRVGKWYIPHIVSQADLNIAHNTPSPVFRYGISLNKLFEYLAAGKPVLVDFPCPYDPVTAWRAGRGVQAPSAEAIAGVSDEMAGLDAEAYRAYCQNARQAADRYFDYRMPTEKLIEIIER